MSRKAQAITLSLQEADKEELKKIAVELGILWGDRPNISGLMEAIARRELVAVPKSTGTSSLPPTKDRVYALYQAMLALLDSGQTEQAEAIMDLLLEQRELPTELQTKIWSFWGLPKPWKKELDRCILQQQPFGLLYQDTAYSRKFTIRYAKIVTRENRQYLDCWCEETVGNQDIPELQHNWSLRLDRIEDAAILPIEGLWLSRLDYVEVEMHLFRGLFFTYQANPGDVVIQQLPGEHLVKQVVRKITNTHCFRQEILRYGRDCVVVSPENVRDRIKQEILAMHYNHNG